MPGPINLFSGSFIFLINQNSSEAQNRISSTRYIPVCACPCFSYTPCLQVRGRALPPGSTQFPTSLPSSADQVFGCQLESLCQREGDTVPSFVRLCVEAVDKKGYFSKDPRPPQISAFKPQSLVTPISAFFLTPSPSGYSIHTLESETSSLSPRSRCGRHLPGEWELGSGPETALSGRQR